MRALLSSLTSLCCKFLASKVDKQGRESVRMGTNIRMQLRGCAHRRRSCHQSPVGPSHVFGVNVFFQWGNQNHEAAKGQEPIGEPFFFFFFNRKGFFFNVYFLYFS